MECSSFGKEEREIYCEFSIYERVSMDEIKNGMKRKMITYFFFNKLQILCKVNQMKHVIIRPYYSTNRHLHLIGQKCNSRTAFAPLNFLKQISKTHTILFNDRIIAMNVHGLSHSF